MMAFIGTPDEIRDLFREDECARHETVLREQMSGPCVHYGPHGCEIPCRTVRTLEPIGDDCEEIEECPHLDNPDVLCPVKDACYAMQEIARMRDACEAEQEEQYGDEEVGA